LKSRDIPEEVSFVVSFVDRLKDLKIRIDIPSQIYSGMFGNLAWTLLVAGEAARSLLLLLLRMVDIFREYEDAEVKVALNTA